MKVVLGVYFFVDLFLEEVVCGDCGGVEAVVPGAFLRFYEISAEGEVLRGNFYELFGNVVIEAF